MGFHINNSTRKLMEQAL